MDLEIFKTDGIKRREKLDTTLYQKPMNKYLFLPFQSAHPLSVFKAWITCYIQRIRVLCSIDKMFETHKEKFHSRLRRRGYPVKFLDQLFGVQYPRNTLLLKQPTKKIRNTNNKTQVIKQPSSYHGANSLNVSRNQLRNAFASRPHSNKTHTSKAF